MLAFTLIFRHSDALALSADVEGVASSTSSNTSPITTSSSSKNFTTSGPDSQTLQSLKNTAKNVLRRLSPQNSGGATANTSMNNNNFQNQHHHQQQSYFQGGNNLVQIELPKEATFVVLLSQGIMFLTVNCVQGTPGSPSAPGAVSLAAAYLEEISREFNDQYGQQALTATRPFMFMRFDNFLSKTKKVFAQRNHFQVMTSNNNNSSHSSGAARTQQQHPTKVSFYKLMGLVEPPGYSVDGNNNSGFGVGASLPGFSSQNVTEAKNSLSSFANTLAKTAKEYNVPGAKKLDKDAVFYLSLGVAIVSATLLALYLVFTLFG